MSEETPLLKFQPINFYPSNPEDLPNQGSVILSVQHKVGYQAFMNLSTQISSVDDFKLESNLIDQTSAFTDSTTLPGTVVSLSNFQLLSTMVNKIHQECICYSDCSQFKYWFQKICQCNYNCGCNY